MKLTGVLLLGLLLNVVPFAIGSFIVPEEFATLLGLVFSTIPQVKKGTDSRIGFGYRFGNHADTQVILELGPQKNTAKLGSNNEGSDDNFTSKREVHPEDYQPETVAVAAESKDWIQKWSQHMNQDQRPSIVVTTTQKPRVERPANVQVQPLIAESALKQLVQLYRKPVSEEPVKEDAQIQFQDRQKVFVKRPSQEKLDHYLALKQYEKKKVSADLSDVGLD